MTSNLQTFTCAGRTIRYRFTPAEVTNAPLVVILHGHTKIPAASRYQSAHWNVLCPIDDFGYEGWGSWYLGERGDFFWLEAMPQLISHLGVSDEYYFCGSSMGGYGALLHGITMRACAVYANIPQTLLLGSRYSESGMKKFFEPIFEPGGSVSPYNDLRNLIKPDLPTSILLSGIRWDKPQYIQEQTLPFMEAMCQHGVNFQSEIRFGEGHSLTYTTAQSVELFRKHSDTIKTHHASRQSGIQK